MNTLNTAPLLAPLPTILTVQDRPARVAVLRTASVLGMVMDAQGTDRGTAPVRLYTVPMVGAAPKAEASDDPETPAPTLDTDGGRPTAIDRSVLRQLEEVRDLKTPGGDAVFQDVEIREDPADAGAERQRSLAFLPTPPGRDCLLRLGRFATDVPDAFFGAHAMNSVFKLRFLDLLEACATSVENGWSHSEDRLRSMTLATDGPSIVLAINPSELLALLGYGPDSFLAKNMGRLEDRVNTDAPALAPFFTVHSVVPPPRRREYTITDRFYIRFTRAGRGTPERVGTPGTDILGASSDAAGSTAGPVDPLFAAAARDSAARGRLAARLHAAVDRGLSAALNGDGDAEARLRALLETDAAPSNRRTAPSPRLSAPSGVRVSAPVRR